MEGLLILLGLIVLGIPVAVVVLLFGQSSLRARVALLERRIEALQLAKATEPAMAAASPGPDGPAEAPLAHPAAEPVPDSAADSPWAAAKAAAAPEAPAAPAPDFAATLAAEQGAKAADADQNRPIVMRADRFTALSRWLVQNWVYAVSGLSLALAGVFLVQYSVQNGLLPPLARVLAALAFGGALIAAGEWVRRRDAAGLGDDESRDTAYIPSIFSGAGIVSIFAAVVAARQLYGLIGPEVALAGHVATAMLAIVLGWFNGPLLVALGLIGAAGAPFLIGSTAPPATLSYAYYGLIALAGLGVDAVRRWAWVSVLALCLSYGGGALMWLGGAGDAGGIALALALVLAAVAVPVLQLLPQHEGPPVSLTLLGRSGGVWPGFPVRIAAGALAVSTAALVLTAGDSAAAGLLAFAGLAALAILLLLWAERAPGLDDLATLPAAGFVLRVWLEAESFWPLASAFNEKAIALRPPETSPSWTATMVLGMGVLISLAFATRALRGGGLRLLFGLGATLTAAVAAAVLELGWAPAEVLGEGSWALQVMAVAALMVALALRFAAQDGADHRRLAHATLSALSLVALALFIVTTDVGLTLALAVVLVVAAALDRRFRLPEMGWFIQAAVAVLSWRLVVDPGLDWAINAPLLPVVAAFGGVILAQVAAWVLIRGLGRTMASGVLESAAMALSALLVNVLLARWLMAGETGGPGDLETYWGVSLSALPWLVLLLVQLYRLRLGGPLVWLRRGIAVLAGLLAMAGLLAAALPLNPLGSWSADWVPGLVRGPMVLDTLALAYGVPGLILVLGGARLEVGRWLRLGLLGSGAALSALYVGLEIRRFWQGDWLGAPGVTQAELYTYTVALMLVGAAFVYQAIARRSAGLRRIGMAVIGLTIAKVFLIDAAGLSGLTRVFSFLGLGISLAGLAWLNRWAGQAGRPAPGAPQQEP